MNEDTGCGWLLDVWIRMLIFALTGLAIMYIIVVILPPFELRDALSFAGFALLALSMDMRSLYLVCVIEFTSRTSLNWKYHSRRIKSKDLDIETDYTIGDDDELILVDNSYEKFKHEQA